MQAGSLMRWAFWILATLNGLMLVAAFLYRSPGEDAAGAGMREGFAALYAIGLAIILVIHHFMRTPWVRLPMLILLVLPIACGISLSL